MAGIDKTYTDSYNDYKEFKDWADAQVLTFFDGHKACIGDWVYDYGKNDFSHGEIPIMNTPVWLDIYLIQNCKSQFVLDRMKDVYHEDHCQEFRSIDLTAGPPEDFTKNRKVIIKRNSRSKFPVHNKSYSSKYWWVQCDDNFWYNSETETWVSCDMYYPHNTNTAHMPSVKSLVRHLRKQYLPKGVNFRITGRCVGEEYSAYIR